jgi:molybdopterin-guanine dinucleotide biosynthesis protein A
VTSNDNQLFGLVLIGGKSARMGTDKSLIVYHNDPQYLHVYKLLSKYCSKVFVSCNKEQYENLNKELPCILDELNDEGPLTGIKTAFTSFTTSWLVAPCDMPFIDDKSIEGLIHNRASGYEAVCYKNKSGFINPLFGVWEISCSKLLKSYSGDSPRSFFETLNLKTILLDEKRSLNVNSKDELNRTDDT